MNTKEKKEHIIDAEGKPLGRIASQAAMYLRGKNLTEWRPNVAPKTVVKVLNCDKVKLTGNKFTDKTKKRYTRYPGSLKHQSFAFCFNKSPKDCVKTAIEGMIPRNRLRKVILKNLILE